MAGRREVVGGMLYGGAAHGGGCSGAAGMPHALPRSYVLVRTWVAGSCYFGIFDNTFYIVKEASKRSKQTNKRNSRRKVAAQQPNDVATTRTYLTCLHLRQSRIENRDSQRRRASSAGAASKPPEARGARAACNPPENRRRAHKEDGEWGPAQVR